MCWWVLVIQARLVISGVMAGVVPTRVVVCDAAVKFRADDRAVGEGLADLPFALAWECHAGGGGGAGGGVVHLARFFVVGALSVIIEVLYFKRTQKWVFLMAPIHHHFEKKGWAEPQIVIRFWIISLILAIIGLATLKLR